MVCGFAAFTSGLYSPYWRRMGILISKNVTENIWQSKHCVLGGDICEKVCDGFVYASAGCGEDILDAYIKNGVLLQNKPGAIWDGKNEKIIVFSGDNGQDGIFYANPSERFVFSTSEEGILSFPGVYDAGGILKLGCGEAILFDKGGMIQQVMV